MLFNFLSRISEHPPRADKSAIIRINLSDLTMSPFRKGWVKKWLKRFREEQAAGVPLTDILPGHSRARKHPPIKTHALVVEQVLAIRDQPPEGLRRVPGQQAIRSYLERDGALLPTGCATR